MVELRREMKEIPNRTKQKHYTAFYPYYQEYCSMKSGSLAFREQHWETIGGPVVIPFDGP